MLTVMIIYVENRIRPFSTFMLQRICSKFSLHTSFTESMVTYRYTCRKTEGATNSHNHIKRTHANYRFEMQHRETRWNQILKTHHDFYHRACVNSLFNIHRAKAILAPMVNITTIYMKIAHTCEPSLPHSISIHIARIFSRVFSKWRTRWHQSNRWNEWSAMRSMVFFGTAKIYCEFWLHPAVNIRVCDW